MERNDTDKRQRSRLSERLVAHQKDKRNLTIQVSNFSGSFCMARTAVGC